MLAKKSLGAAPAAEALYVEDVFSTYLYSGQSSGTITIDNGIDLSGEGGLVWIKQRNGTSGHQLCDTERGITNRLQTNTTGAQSSEAFLGSVTSTGFTLPANYSDVSGSTGTYASWTFRKAEKFFDVVTYTGTGSARTVSHNLGSTPGCIIVKRTDSTGSWVVYHRVPGATQFATLNTTNGFNSGTSKWNDTAPTSTVFTVGTEDFVNASGGTFVAYLFAHDAGGFGDDGDQNVISCGSFEETGSDVTVSLGYEPQWLLIKRTDSTSNWFLYDNMRGLGVTDNQYLQPNTSSAESNNSVIKVTATGFVASTFAGSGADWIYIAIRRGPMKTPTSGTSVFTPTVYTGTNADNRLINTTIAPDMVMIKERNDTVDGMVTGDRLRGNPYLLTGTTDAEVNDANSLMTPTSGVGNAFSAMNGVGVGNDATSKVNIDTTSNNHVIWAFKRAPGFFDVVCYTGTGVTRTVDHNLSVAPELIIVKRRNTTASWAVYAAPLTASYVGFLDLNNAFQADNLWDSTAPTSTVFTVRGANTQVNASGSTYVAYLFASVSGVSKVGSYTGNGSSQTINCGFTAGARFVLIKRTDDSQYGDWRVFDTARGMSSSTAPYIVLNEGSGETATTTIETTSTGFIVDNDNQMNVNSASYIYLAIA